MPVKKLFLSVGAMKAGTTFLFNIFNSHPDLYFTPEKELHFFAHMNGLSDELHQAIVPKTLPLPALGGSILTPAFRRHRLSMVLHNRFAKLKDADRLREIVLWYADKYLADPIDDAWFDRAFEAAGDRYAADFSNYHALLPSTGWDHVRRMANELKVIYVVREPVARLWSHIKFHLIQAGQRDKLLALDTPELERILETGPISSHGRYGDIVAHLQRNLKPDQLKIVVFEDFIEKFPESAREVEIFLGIRAHDYSNFSASRKANATENLAIPPEMEARLKEVTRPQVRKLRELVGAVADRYI
jgi:hypothetical protein